MLSGEWCMIIIMSLIYKHPWLLFSGLLLFITFSYHEAASSPVLEPTVEVPQYQISGTTPTLSATAFGVYDLKSGEMLISNNETTSLPIASVTKLATASVLASNYALETTAPITATDLLAEGRAGKLEVGEQYTYRELIFPLLLESSNDAAEFFSRVSEGSLIEEMNHLAEKLKLVQTNFADSSGLSDKNVSSVSDLQQLMRYVYEETPLVLDISRLRKYVGPYKGWVNNSPIWHDDYRGGKHGFTEAANRTALALYEEEFVGGKKLLIYVILGSDNLAKDMEILRDFIKTGVTYE